MEKSKVYFTDLRAHRVSLVDKLEKLLISAGFRDLDLAHKLVAIKISFGEPGNLAYLRPNYAARVAKMIRLTGGTPFLTDANTLYLGRRSNAIDHLESAFENGYSPFSGGAHVIIADGLKGVDFEEIPVEGAKHCPTAKIASAIAHADAIISLNHFKGHEQAGFGGALKNIGMGSGSRAGKMEMHSNSKPKMIPQRCVSCGVCLKSCPEKAISFNAERKASIDYLSCIGCGQCIAMCRFGSATPASDANSAELSEKIAEYTKAVLADKPNLHVNFIMDVSPNCDCWPLNDAPIVPNIGILASADPVALDMASAVMVTKAPSLKASVLSDKHYQEGDDKFKHIHPDTDWRAGIAHAVAIGLGSDTYTLIRV